MDLGSANFELSEKVSQWVTAGSMLISLLSLAVTVVALYLTARAVRDAQADSRAAKEAEERRAYDARLLDIVKIAAGGTDAYVLKSDGTRSMNQAIMLAALDMIGSEPRNRRIILLLEHQYGEWHSRSGGWDQMQKYARDILSRNSPADSVER